MVSAGFAIALPQFSTAYLEHEARIQSLGFGIWGSEFEKPEDYRAAHPAPKQVARASMREANSGPRTTGVYYRNCDEARAAGAAPIYRGQPGYRPGMDGDNDGIACEPYRGRR
jgi:hypothetical protein